MSLPEIFYETISPTPQNRKRAEDYLCESVTNTPQCALDILAFAADWGNLSSPNLVWSRLAAAIFVKNLIAHSAWGSSSSSNNNSNQTASSTTTHHNNNNKMSVMFGTFSPPPTLQQEIRNQLIRAMVSWRGAVIIVAGNENENKERRQVAAVEETILRYIQTAVECIHDTDWPSKWPELFSQAISEFRDNVVPVCASAMTVFSSSSQKNNQNQNFFLREDILLASSNNDNNNNPLRQFTEALHRGSAALCILKLCCKRLFSEIDSIQVDQQLYDESLRTLGESVLVPFMRIVANVAWSRMFVHAFYAENNHHNPSSSSSSNDPQQQQVSFITQAFQKAWVAFSYEGLKALFFTTQTQIYQSLLSVTVPVDDEQQQQQEVPFLFAIVGACTKMHHALFCRVLVRREHAIIINNNSQNSGTTNNHQQHPQNKTEQIFNHENRHENGMWRLWKRVWALLHLIFDHLADGAMVPKRIRRGHKQWILEQFGPVLNCAVAMAILHDNRSCWRICNNNGQQQPAIIVPSEVASMVSFSCISDTCANPSIFATQCVLKSFVRCCAAEAVDCLQSGAPLCLAPFRGAEHRTTSEAATFAMDVLELSLKFIPWVWTEDRLFLSVSSSSSSFFDLVRLQDFPEQISQLFRAPSDDFVAVSGSFSWFFTLWLLLPRLAIDCDEVEQWEINPAEYLISVTDPTLDLYNMKSAASTVLTAFLSAKIIDSSSSGGGGGGAATRGGGGNKKKSQQQQNASSASAAATKTRIHFLIDFTYEILQKANSEGGCTQARFDIMSPHPALLAADAGLQLLRLYRRAVLDRNDVETAVTCGVLPLFKSRFGPLRAKSAQVASELCAAIEWSSEQAFQKVLTGALDLMYDDELPVRMQVCMRLSPLLRHHLAGTVVVPHLVRIVQQFFDIMAQNQSDTVVRTLRKLFAHYRDHMSAWAVDLAKIILARFEQVVFALIQMDQDDIADEISGGAAKNSEFMSAVGGGGGGGGRQHNQQHEMRRDVLDATMVGDELLDAISTIVKCVPRPSSSSSSSNNNNDTEQQRQTINALQEVLGPMLLAMFDSPNSMGFFEGGLKLISRLLSRSATIMPQLWEVFGAMFRLVVIRGTTDYFTNMISTLDNYASADPQGLLVGRQQQQQQQQNNNARESKHPAEAEPYMVQALEMVRTICGNNQMCLTDVANAMQCIDCFVLNGARCVPQSVVAIFGDSSQNRFFSGNGGNNLEELARTNDPLRIKGFMDVPVLLTQARQNLLPPDSRKLGLISTPSMSLLMSNAIFCCLLAAPPVAIVSDTVLQNRALLSFQLVARLFDLFGGVGSGEYRKPSDLAQVPLSFRIYDRKLFILALSQFVHQLVAAERRSGANNNDSNSPLSGFFGMVQQENFNPPQLLSTLLRCAVMMAIENAHYDTRMLESLVMSSSSSPQQNNQNNEFFVDDRGGCGGDDDDESDFDDEDSDVTDCTTDDDLEHELGLYNDEDDEDEEEGDDGEDNYGGGDNYDDDEDNHHQHQQHGDGSRAGKIRRMAANAAALRSGYDEDYDGNGDDDAPEFDDFNENLLLEDASDSVTTPIDSIDEFRVFGQTLEMVVVQQQQQQQQFVLGGIVADALSNLTRELGQVPICREKIMASTDYPGKKKASSRRKKKLLQQQQQQEGPNNQKREMTWALLSFKQENEKSGGASSLALQDFLRACSQQRSKIDTF